MKGPIKSFFVVCATAVAIASCGGLKDGAVLKESFWTDAPASKNTEAELGLAEMTKGNYVTAEGHFQMALRKDPKDVHAYLGLGILYQNTGQKEKARKAYEQVIALHPDKVEQFVILNNLRTQSILDVAQVNLSLLDSGAVPAEMGIQSAQPVPGTPGAVTNNIGQPGVSGSSQAISMMGRTSQPPVRGGLPGEPMSVLSMFSHGDKNIVSRFVTLQVLKDEGLLTGEEFAQRRKANIGALLPLTSPPPATGLDRPVASAEQVSARLRAIGRALEMRALTVSQHASERSMILDALMPASPMMVANPGRPPQGLMQAADAVRRLELLKDHHVITSDEYQKERTAIEQALQPDTPGATMAKPMTDKTTETKEAVKPAMSGPQPAIHLASYRNQKDAVSGWNELRKKYSSILGGLQSEIKMVNLGPRKGKYYRLKVGPFPSQSEAKKACRSLKAKRQYCEPTFMTLG